MARAVTPLTVGGGLSIVDHGYGQPVAIGDVTSAETLTEVRDFKKAQKAAKK